MSPIRFSLVCGVKLVIPNGALTRGAVPDHSLSPLKLFVPIKGLTCCTKSLVS